MTTLTDRPRDFDLHWQPDVQGPDSYRAQYQLPVSPAPGAHIVIDLPLPGPCVVTVTIEKEREPA